MYDVFFFEAFDEEQDALKKCVPPGMRVGFAWQTIQEYGCREPPAALVSIRTQSVLPARWRDRIAGILTRSTGYEHVEALQREWRDTVQVGYLPLYCSRAVAEQAAMLWMALLRKLPRQVGQLAHFERNGLTGRECLGRTLVVVGVGNIGGEAARIGAGLGMRVRGVDIVERHSEVVYVTREQGLAEADVLVCAMNLTTENTGYFDYDALARTRKGTVFVNVARGEMSPAADLLRLLAEGRLGGVGLDVYERESDLAVALRGGQPCDGPEARAILALAERQDAILTPHNAFNTREAVERKALDSFEQVRHFMEEGCFLWPVKR